ncbi:hypothetical protein MTR_3g071750 [Medicago truncatula]|uniref:Uncharacterized protein n=1 Tax=Medicago truncatula TaxID=3880 RepID=G7J2D5_MEDTR|nr:hypothetical protein MTR_3g071750 [Medicago truncatula]
MWKILRKSVHLNERDVSVTCNMHHSVLDTILVDILFEIMEAVKEYDVNEGEEIDIVTVDKDNAFSDSDIFLEELCF